MKSGGFTVSATARVVQQWFADGGGCEWWFNGHPHCEEGPAIDYPTTKEWWIHGQLHRGGGRPAVEWLTLAGRNQWWVRNKRHREDGPADELTNEWFLSGVNVTKRQHAAWRARRTVPAAATLARHRMNPARTATRAQLAAEHFVATQTTQRDAGT